MALVTRLQESQKQESTNDITRNLQSLQFESALSGKEKDFIGLRARSHAILVAQCAVVTVTIDVLQKARAAQINLTNVDRHQRKGQERDSFKIGIIGCGRLGTQIAHCLLTYGQVHPSMLQISTRRPEILERLCYKGVDCYYNNEQLVSSVSVVIICVLPSQMPGLAEEVKHSLPASLLIISLLSSISLHRLRQMLGTSNIIQPVLQWPERNPDPNYQFCVNVNTALKSEQTVLGTCPLVFDKDRLFVSVDERVAEIIILAVINMCCDCGLTQKQTLAILDEAVFGETCEKPLTYKHLMPRHFGAAEARKDADKNCFSLYDLVDAHEKGTPLLKVLLENVSVRSAYVSCYCHIFKDYIHKEAYGQVS